MPANGGDGRRLADNLPAISSDFAAVPFENASGPGQAGKTESILLKSLDGAIL
jgi:hypothetical protein